MKNITAQANLAIASAHLRMLARDLKTVLGVDFATLRRMADAIRRTEPARRLPIKKDVQ